MRVNASRREERRIPTAPLWLETLSPYWLVLYPLAVFVALFRYELLGLDRALVRGFAYSLLTAVALAAFYGAIGLASALSPGLVGGERGSVWIIAGATLLLGLSIAPVQRRVQRLLERRLLPERTVLRERLATLARDLPRRGKLRSVAAALVEETADVFGSAAVTVLLAEEKSDLLVARAATRQGTEWTNGLLLSTVDPFVEALLEDARALDPADWLGRSAAADRLVDLGLELAVPLVAEERLVGVLAVGGKRSGRAYRPDERELLNLLASHVASVLENAALFESATVDPLTGLLRREAVLEHLEREVERARRYGRPLAVAMADLDHFKKVNDTHGHLMGDVVLRRVGRVLRRGLRRTDLCGRYGGEEFLLVLPETDRDAALQVIDDLRRLIGDLEIEASDGRSVGVTVSVGIAALDAWIEDPTAEAALEAADRQLYEAKAGGRNRVAV